MSEQKSDLTESRATRVADVQRQAVPMLMIALGFTVAAPVAALVPHRTGAWLPLHLFLVGGLLPAIAGATQLLAVTWSAAPAPRDRVASIHRWLIVAGVVAVAAGRESDNGALVGAGGVTVVALILMLAASLKRIRHTAATDRFHPAIDGYLIGFGFALVGIAAGSALATNLTGSWWVRVRDAHVAVNVLGFVGVVIAATLPYFVATQARMKMSRRATPARLRAGLGCLAVATAVAAGGHLGGAPVVSGTGYLAYAIGLGLVVAHVPPVRSRQIRWAGPRLLQLGTGFAWWAAGTVALALEQFGAPVDRPTVLRVIAVGGYAQILVASLAYFGPVLRGGGHERLTAGFRVTRSWLSLAAGNAAACALAVDARPATVVAMLIWAGDTATRAVRLVRGADRRPLPLEGQTQAGS